MPRLPLARFLNLSFSNRKGVNEMQYSIPSIMSLDAPKMYLFKNQATCGPEILQGEALHESSIGGGTACGWGNVLGPGNTVGICLTGVIDENLLEGLTVNTTDGNSFVMSNCSQNNVATECGISGYLCNVSGGTYAQGVFPCVISLECPDGTNVDTCSTSSCNIFIP
jgi:hypothetical protein